MMQKRALIAAVAALAMNAASGANPTCEAQANDKKLAGAARTSFVTKCEKDAKAGATQSCDAKATEKQISGAARTSFTKTCVTDATTAVK